jgi:hypothetical protein
MTRVVTWCCRIRIKDNCNKTIIIETTLIEDNCNNFFKIQDNSNKNLKNKI